MGLPLYRPSVVVNFKITFDESLLPNSSLPTPQSVDDTASAVAQPTSPTNTPSVLSTGSNVSFIMGRIPKAATWELPGYRQAATFSLTFDFRELPIDPRAVRACAVEIHSGAVTDSDFARGITQIGIPQGGQRASILQTRTASGGINYNTLRMVGTCDEWEAVHDENGSIVTIKGRDMRAFLIDTPIGVDPVRANKFLSSIDLSQTINIVVAQILSLNPLFGEFTVAVNEAEWPDQTLPSPGDSKIIPRSRLPARAGKGKGKAAKPSLPSGLDKLTFWDLIVKFCYLCGAIPYFQGTTLNIRPSRSIFDQQRAGFDPSIPTPFLGGKPRSIDAQTGTAIDPGLSVRKLLYGRDVKSMSFNRKFGGYQKPRVVRVVGINPNGTGQVGEQFISATWPPTGPTAKLTTKMAPSATKAEEEILNIPVHGITDIARLQEIAKSVFEEVGRGEMGGTAESPTLASFGGDNNDPDLLRLQPGDGVYLDVNIASLRSNSPLISTLIDTARRPFNDQVQAVADSLGGDRNLALAIVSTARGQVGQLQQFFRVSTVRYSWTTGKLDVNFDFQNYVVTRNQQGTVSADPGKITPTSAANR